MNDTSTEASWDKCAHEELIAVCLCSQASSTQVECSEHLQRKQINVVETANENTITIDQAEKNGLSCFRYVWLHPTLFRS